MPSEFLIQKCFFNTRSIGCEILKLFLGRSNKMLLELSMTLGTLLGKYFFLRDSASNPEGVIRDSRVSVSDVFYTVSRDYLPCILEMEGVKEGKSMAGKDLRKRKGRKDRVGGEEMEKRKRWSRY